MTERNRVVQGILTGLQEAVAVQKGTLQAARTTILEVEDAITARKALKLSREKFADLIGVSERTLEGWEQGRTKPSAAARSLLKVAARNPEAVLQALQ
jgi:putative transcriptional regulator